MSDADTAKPVDAGEVKPVEAQPAAEVEATTTDTQADTTASILKTTAKHDQENPRNNRKFDPSSREVTDDPDVIRKQVEFYFGDWNFPQDKFMWETCGGSENKSMPLKTIHSFKRMRSFQPYSAVVAALKESPLLVIEGEEGDETVRRKSPYKPMQSGKARFEAATVYVKGFGDETPGTQFDLESFFSNFGDVKGLKLRRTNQNLFKGSVFVTFADEDMAKKFISLDPAPKWEEHELKIMSKHDYCEEKNELIRQGKLEPNSTAPRRFYEGKDSGAKNGGRGPRDRDDWKQRREHDQKNGFQDRRGGGRGRGRGGRGRGGRGGRGGHRDDRRDNRRNNDEAPKDVAATELSEAAANGKRGRDEDAPAGEPAAKKVDTKEEAKTEA